MLKTEEEGVKIDRQQYRVTKFNVYRCFNCQ